VGFVAWCRRHKWSLVAALSWIPAFFVPRYLSAIDHSPPVGVYVAVMGAVAAAVTFRKDPSATEKATWIVLITLLMIAEVRNLYVGDAKQAAKFADIEKRLTSAVDGIGTAIKNGQQQLSKQDALLGKTADVAELARKNLASVTGKDSFPCIVPQSHAASDTSIPLFIWNKGRNNLTGVEIRILSAKEFLSGALFFKPPLELGTIPPTWGKPVPESISPELGSDGTAGYTVQIWDQTGFYTEVMSFRRGKYLLPWAYKYWLTEHVILNKTTTESVPVAGCSSAQWSDDLGDGKPVPKPPS